MTRQHSITECDQIFFFHDVYSEYEPVTPNLWNSQNGTLDFTEMQLHVERANSRPSAADPPAIAARVPSTGQNDRGL